jgi:hypothetical protein
MIVESAFYKYLYLSICNFFIDISNFYVFVLHRRCTNVSCTVAPDGLLNVAIHMDTGSGILQRERSFVRIAGKE